MLKNLIKCMSAATFVCSAGFPASIMAQESTPVSIPDALVGSYVVQMVNTTAASPIPAGTETTVTITASGTLCTQGLVLKNPVLRDEAINLAYWDAEESDLSFVLDTDSVIFSELSVTSLTGSSYGRLAFLEVATNPAECGTIANLDIINDFFDAVEDSFDNLFPTGAFSFNQFGSGFDVFRFYQETGVYLAVRDGIAYARGGAYGDQFIQVGDVDEITDDSTKLLKPSPIPSFYRGTYRLTLTDSQPFSPLMEGTELIFVIASNGRMCVGELELTAPVISGNQGVIWAYPNGDLRYFLDTTRDDALTADEYTAEFAKGIISYQSASGVYFGSFEGEKVSLSTDCGDANGGNPDLDNINELFALAEQQYPDLFPVGPHTYNKQNDGYVYRYYYATGIFVGVKNGVVYLNGGQFGTSAQPVAFGTLSSALAQLNETIPPPTVPTSQMGTYAVTFSDVTSYSPFTEGTSANVVITAAGGLCMNGVELASGPSKSTSPGFVVWENANVGLNLSLDLNDVSTTDLSLQVSSLNGLSYATLEGSKTSLASACGAIDIASANQLFSLAEQYYPDLFPASALSFNQISGNTVTRYYAATGISISIDGGSVNVKGGQFGAGQTVGTVSQLIDEIVTANTPLPETPPTPPTYIYDMFVEGTSRTQFGNLAIVNGQYESRKYAIARPDSANIAALKAVVALAISDAVTKVDSSTVSVFSDTPEALILTATVSSDSITGVDKDFQLVITIQRRL